MYIISASDGKTTELSATVDVTATIYITKGGIHFKGAMVQPSSGCRVFSSYPHYRGLTIQGIDGNSVTFMADVPMSRRRADAICDKLYFTPTKKEDQ